MIRFLTAGESHGKALSVIIEGFPSNMEIDKKYLDFHLKRRMIGDGRGDRMKIETDECEIISGVRNGKTLGSPISVLIKNKDWENWQTKMSIDKNNKKVEKITVPRPGHADLVGSQKYDFDDIRNVIERASARETACRVVAGSVARKFLENFGISIGSFVESIGGIYPRKNYSDNLFNNKIKEKNAWEISLKADKNQVRVFDQKHENEIIKKIEEANQKGETLGGTFYIIATGVPVGLGSYVHYDRKINADISAAMMSINAVKGVEIGMGFQLANIFGSSSNDEITRERKTFSRKTNHSGGIEGGMTTGLPIIVRVAMKPIPTLMSPMNTIDILSRKNLISRKERSDVVAVPACSVVAESMLAWIIAKYFKEKFGGDSMQATKQNY
ncbi:MAG: chorismate synthase [Ignavibacteriales bacterium]|nr:chorismate synthase [Ignavibacteriales bacterium]